MAADISWPYSPRSPSWDLQQMTTEDQVDLSVTL